MNKLLAGVLAVLLPLVVLFGEGKDHFGLFSVGAVFCMYLRWAR